MDVRRACSLCYVSSCRRCGAAEGRPHPSKVRACHIPIPRLTSVWFTHTDQLFRRLKAARLDNTVQAEMRRLARGELLMIDDLALQAMDPVETAAFYELTVERATRSHPRW